jgi:hypothetical protein
VPLFSQHSAAQHTNITLPALTFVFQMTQICAETESEKLEWIESIKFNIQGCDSSMHTMNPLVAVNLKKSLAQE